MVFYMIPLIVEKEECGVHGKLSKNMRTFEI